MSQWNCPQCTLLNNEKAQVCAACYYPEVVIEQQELVGTPPVESQPDVISNHEAWLCTFCGWGNTEKSSTCAVCKRPKPQENITVDPTTPVVEEPRIEQWACPVCTLLNSFDTSSCEACEYNFTNSAQQTESISLPITPRSSSNSISTVTTGLFRYGAFSNPNGCFFRVWAPQAIDVFVAGDWNRWSPYAHRLQLDQDNESFSGHVPGAQPGHRYKYLIKLKDNPAATLWRTDPCAVLVLNDRPQNSVIYDQSAFPWEHDLFHCPQVHELVIYELHIWTFSHDASVGHGTWRSAVDKLDHLVQLGVNAVELMPFSRDLHDRCWGYDPVSMFALHPAFGTPDDLKAFVQAAHARKLAVLADWVPNHLSSSCFLRAFDTSQPTAFGSYFNSTPALRQTPYGPRLDLKLPSVRQHVLESACVLLEHFHIDGLRVDSTNTLRKDAHGKELPEAWQLMQELTDLVHRQWPGKLIIAEDLQKNDMLNHGVAGFDSQWDPFFFSVMYATVVVPGDEQRDPHRVASAISHRYLNGAFTRIIYTETHDTAPSDRQRHLPDAIATGGESFYARKRTALAASLLFTSPGIPMLLQGQEMLEVSHFSWPKPPPLTWSRLEKFPGIFALFKDLISLRRNLLGTTQGLCGENVRITHVNSHGCVVAFHRWDRGGPGDDVMVLCNLSNRVFHEYKIGFPRQGSWTILFNSDNPRYSADFRGGGSALGSAIDATPHLYDNLPFTGTLAIGVYSVIILAQLA